MRILSAIAMLAAGFAVTACTYVERERPAPAPVVLQQPAQQPTVLQAPPPTVTVRPSY
ncbi:hypothetical protein [Dankookia sp. P2]|uniref:hypothetical protein n=1 Tax=Dankookia sp. P2 TaxID=3423955 RepID=UPI003D66C24B